MAKEVIAKVGEQEELRVLLRELSAELALADSYEYKNRCLLENLSRHNAAKTKSLVEEYESFVEDANGNAAEKMNREIELMDSFSASVEEFNDACTEYLMRLVALKSRAKGEK